MRLLMLALTLAGCATTGANSAPLARHDADPPVARWEHWCFDVDGVPKNSDLVKAGAEGWELVAMSFRPPLVQSGASFGGGATLVCFKRRR